MSAARSVSRQSAQSGVDHRDVEVFLPRVVDAVGHLLGHGQVALVSGGPPPMIDQLVARHPHQPGHVHPRHASLPGGLHGRHEGLGRQVLSDNGAAAAGQQVAVHLGQRCAVDRHDRVDLTRLFDGAHTTSSFDRPRFRTWDMKFRPGASLISKVRTGLAASHSSGHARHHHAGRPGHQEGADHPPSQPRKPTGPGVIWPRATAFKNWAPVIQLLVPKQVRYR